jgi:hypothetical protein
MRTIKIGDKEISIKATPLTLLYYKQAFKTNLTGDLMKMQAVEKDPSKMDDVIILQMTWAMAKANEGMGKKFPDFQTWVAELEEFDFTEITQVVMEEAMDGFFRGSKKQSRK